MEKELKVTGEETKRIAELARIELDEGEVVEMAKDLSKILDFVSKINELDTANVKETDHALEIQNIFRRDINLPSIDKNKAMELGPETENGHYVVPAIIE